MSATPCSRSRATKPNSRSVSRAESAAVGSSRIRQRASSESARAISTTCRSPTDRPPTGASSGEVDAELLEHPRRAAAHVAPADDPAAAGPAAERDVLGDRQRRRVGQLLEDHPHAEPARRDRVERGVRLAPDDHLAGVRLVVAGDDLHQRRLAGPVLAEEGEHGPAGGDEVHAVEDLDAAESLADVPDLEPERGRRLSSR